MHLLSLRAWNKIAKVPPFLRSNPFRLLGLLFGGLFLVFLLINSTHEPTPSAARSTTTNYSIRKTTERKSTTTEKPFVESKLSYELKEKVRVFCWIATWEKSEGSARGVNETWAPHCNKYVFVTPLNSSGLPSLNVHMKSGRQGLWEKTKRAFRRIYEEHLEDYDFFLKIDSDSYVQVENMRMMLAPHSPDEPLYFGCRFKAYVTQGYMSGGAGYILSREALRRFVEEALIDPQKCRLVGGQVEDLEMGRCLEAVGVRAMDTRDKQGRHRMVPLSPSTGHVHGEHRPDWMKTYMFYEYPRNHSTNFEHIISFHYVQHRELHDLYRKYYPSRVLSVEEIGMIAANNRTGLPTIVLSNETVVDMRWTTTHLTSSEASVQLFDNSSTF